MARRLTERQIAVLAAVERLGNPTIPELAREFPHLQPSTVWPVVEALERHGKVVIVGDRHWAYLGSPADLPPGANAPQIESDQIVRVSALSP